MGKMVSTIKGVRKDAYFDDVLNGDGSTEEKLERLRTEVRFAGVLNANIPRGTLVSRTPARATSAPRQVAKKTPCEEKPSVTVDAQPFDPYAIHTTNIFKSDGADGLLKALESITDTAHLKSMVSAQRIPVADVEGIDDASTLRTSIVDAVGQRIADRKAAAS